MTYPFVSYLTIRLKKTKNKLLRVSLKKLIFSEDQPQFVVMLKKGNKQTFKALELPPDHEFFVELKSREEVNFSEIY